MRKLIVLATLAVALAAPATSGAGGWATVGIEPLPDGTDAGGTWSPRITILQHGQTPLDGLAPVVTISEDGGASEEFLAMQTEEPGVYDASVVFPEEGNWRIVVDSGFGESRLTYGPIVVDNGSPAGGDGRFVAPTGLAVFGAALLLLAAGALGMRRLRRLTPAGR